MDKKSFEFTNLRLIVIQINLSNKVLTHNFFRFVQREHDVMNVAWGFVVKIWSKEIIGSSRVTTFEKKYFSDKILGT